MLPSDDVGALPPPPFASLTGVLSTTPLPPTPPRPLRPYTPNVPPCPPRLPGEPGRTAAADRTEPVDSGTAIEESARAAGTAPAVVAVVCPAASIAATGEARVARVVHRRRTTSHSSSRRCHSSSTSGKLAEHAAVAAGRAVTSSATARARRSSCRTAEKSNCVPVGNRDVVRGQERNRCPADADGSGRRCRTADLPESGTEQFRRAAGGP